MYEHSETSRRPDILATAGPGRDAARLSRSQTRSSQAKRKGSSTSFKTQDTAACAWCFQGRSPPALRRAPIRRARNDAQVRHVKKEAVVMLIEDYLVASPEQEREVFYLPVAGVSSEKDHDGVEVLGPQLPPVSPCAAGLRMSPDRARSGWP